MSAVTLNRVKRRDLITLALILLIAALLRLGDITIVEFKHDEALLSLLALDALEMRSLPLTGINSSVGIPNPPISVYVMMLPYAISSDPLFATLFIAGLNLLGVGLLWWIAARYFNATIALVAGLTYALSPWAVYYSRKIWAQDFHTPFVLLALLLGLYGFVEGKRWAQSACLPVLIIALQIHFAAWALLPLWIVLIMLGRGRVAWRAVLLSISLAFVTLLPYLNALATLLETDPNRITNALLGGAGVGFALSGAALTDYAQLATGYGLEAWLAPENSAALFAAAPPTPFLWGIIGMFTLVGAVAVILWRRMRWVAPPLLAWALLPLLVFTPTWTKVYSHYFVASIPALCLLAGLGVGWLLHLLNQHARSVIDPRFSRAIVLGGFCVLLLMQGWWWRGAVRFIAGLDTPGGFGTPLGYLRPVREALANARDVMVISDGSEILYDQEPAVWSVLLHDSAECVRALAGDGLLILPANPFAVLVAPNAPEHTLDGVYEDVPSEQYDLRSGEGRYVVYDHSMSPIWRSAALREIRPVHFDNGARLIGYHLATGRMTIKWWLPGRAEQDYQYFGHLLDAAGEKINQYDAPFLAGRYWCAEDTVLTFAELILPREARTLRVGMYALRVGGGYINSSILDGNGNAVGTWVDIPLEENDATD